MTLQWNERLSVGHPKIDQQHKELVDTLNNVYAATKEGKGRQEAVNALAFLEQYVIKHFQDEEQLQLNSRYPGYKEHQELHQVYKQNIKEIKDIYEKEGASFLFMSKLNTSISQWIIRHIQGPDQQLGKYLKEMSK